MPCRPFLLRLLTLLLALGIALGGFDVKPAVAAPAATAQEAAEAAPISAEPVPVRHDHTA
jgi:hypothetical protein